MESLVAALGNYPLLQIVGAVIIIVSALIAMRKGAQDGGKDEPPLVTEVDLLRLRQTISDEQSDSRRRIWESITGLHNSVESEKERQRERHHELSERVATLEAMIVKRR